MIEKKKIMQQLCHEEDKILASRLYDLARQAKGGWRPSGFFLDPAKCRWIDLWFRDCESVLWGGYEEAERRMVSFGDSFAEQSWFPVSALRIKPFLPWEVSHRDVLGSVMGLGIDRAKTGDILVTEEQAVLFCDAGLAGYIAGQLESVGRFLVKAEITAPDQIEIPPKKYQETSDTVASLRADCIIASIYSLSRGKAQEAIASGRVTVNWEELTSLNTELKAGDVISLRGMGRSELTEIGGFSRKGRIVIHTRRFL